MKFINPLWDGLALSWGFQEDMQLVYESHALSIMYYVLSVFKTNVDKETFALIDKVSLGLYPFPSKRDTSNITLFYKFSLSVKDETKSL